MLIKAYIKRNFYHLPMDQTALYEKIITDFKLPKLDKTNIQKLYAVTETDNENIIVKKQNTNIFLLNLYIKVMNKNKIEITEPVHTNNAFLIEKLAQETNNEKILQISLVEDVEKEVGNYLFPTPKATPQKQEQEQEQEQAPETAKPNTVLDNVKFNLAWLKKAHKEL